MTLKNNWKTLLTAVTLTGAVLTGGVFAAASETVSEELIYETEEMSELSELIDDDEALADGYYSAVFDTDSGMFHANEANDGLGLLIVENGEMRFHVSLASKNIVNLYLGLAEDAAKEDAELLEPTTDTVVYSDGIAEEVYGFDIPVAALDQEFDLALIGKKAKWYDHKVSISSPEPIDEEMVYKLAGQPQTAEAVTEAVTE